ncbi:MAG: glycosyltransferase [Lachnospiraceae bacterium]|nr:glycosyltransferase [Lachnospiraceae bacterium]
MAEKKRIALFINSLSGGGAERVVSRIARELDKEYGLYIFLVEGKKRFYECAGTIVDLGSGKERYIVNVVHAVCNINKAVRKYKIDCVMSFLDMPNLINCLFCHKVKKIANIRNYTDAESCRTWKEKVKFIILRDNLKRADKVIFASQELRMEMVEVSGIEPAKAVAIENPYDAEEIDHLSHAGIEPDIERFIREHRTAVAVGRLDEQKGYDELLDIFAQVCKKDCRAALVILGEGALKKDMEEWIRDRQLEKRVMLLGLRENPFAYMGRCCLYVSCSLHEGFPNALVEAMACGLPAIHTDCRTGPREIITGGLAELNIRQALYSTYGILIPSHTRALVSRDMTKKEFADAWVQLLSSDETCEKYREVSRVRAVHFGMAECLQKYQAAIDSVLQS